jgi:hypothetical protein
MDKKSILFWIGLVAVVVLSVTFIPESPDKEMIGLGITVLYVISYFFFFRKKTSEKEKQIRAKIDQLKSEGQELKLEQEANFNDQDMTILYKHKRFITWMVILGMLVLNGMIIGVMQVTADLNNKLLWQALVFSVVTGGLGWFHVYYQRKFLNLISTGKKTIIRGIVTHKRIDGDETDTHFLEIDSLSVFVEKKIYDKYEIGDGIEIHIFKPRHNMLLYEAKIETMNLK